MAGFGFGFDRGWRGGGGGGVLVRSCVWVWIGEFRRLMWGAFFYDGLGKLGWMELEDTFEHFFMRIRMHCTIWGCFLDWVS